MDHVDDVPEDDAPENDAPENDDEAATRAAFDRELAAYRARNIAAFLEGGEPIGPFGVDPGGLLLLDTRDVSGEGVRSSLLFLVADDGGIVVFGPHRTSERPTWYEDVQAHPTATACRWEAGEMVRFEVVAEPLHGADAEALYPTIVQAQPAWTEYGSADAFPVVRLHRVGADDEAPSLPETSTPVPLLRRLMTRWTGPDTHG